ncbi:helix-turn-helix domain-containing protein [Clostridium lundense]|uniref:helix-turn-helix domain-containing protein n=1 Tax=Clostridium lundense TaxID=319475 RepID=UPI0004878F93|nr:helix-turn-helix domain-containing protein [Clostridium lundense]
MRREFIDYTDNLPIKIRYENIIEYPMHWHDAMEIVYVLKGSVKITIETETHVVNEQEIEIINSDEAHRIYSKDKDNRIITFQIDNSFFDKFYNIDNIFFYTESSGKDPQKGEKYEQLRKYLSIILCEGAQKGEDYEDAIEDTLVELLYHLINNFHYLIYEEDSLKENEEQFERYDRIIKYIYSNYNNKISLQDIARREYLSSHYLSSGIKNTVGYSFNDFLNLTRVEEAIKLLLDTDKTISEISEELGFSHTRYFNKHFKKHYKCTPMQYRKKYKVDEEKFREMKKFTSYPIKQALEEVSYYLEDYLRFNYQGKIIKIDVDFYSEGQALNKTWHNIIKIGKARKLLINNRREILSEVQRNIGFKYGLLEEVFSRDTNVFTDEESEFFYWHEIKEVVTLLLTLEITPVFFLDSVFDNIKFGFKLLESFIQYFKDIFGQYEIDKWRFYVSNNLKEKNKKQLANFIKDNWNMEVLGEEIFIGECNAIYDTCYMIPYIIQMYLEEDNNIAVPELFDESDEECNINNELFFGGKGIINKQGLKKPSYYAYYFLSHLGDTVIDKGDGYIITKSEDDIQILLYSYNEELEESMPLEKLYKRIVINNIIERKFSINLAALSYDYRVIKYSINKKKGSCYDSWIAIGRPERVYEEEIELLKKISIPEMKLFFAKKSPIYNIVSQVGGYGGVLITLQKVQKGF